MKEYKTKDIFEASWIYSQNIPLLRLEPDKGYYWFVFDDAQHCESLSSMYWSQKASGNIKVFVSSLKTLKDLLFSRKSGN